MTETKTTPNPSSHKSPLEGGKGGVNFQWCLSFLEKRGKELFGDKFKIILLCAYGRDAGGY